METRKRLDIGGILISIGCLFHCILLPYFFTGLSILGLNILNNFYIELALVVAAGLFGVISLYKSIKIHREHKIVIIFAIGFLLLFSKLWFVGSSSEAIFSIIALPCIILAHIWNILLCHKHKSCTVHNCLNKC